MRFLVDAQLPAALARWPSARGHHAEHVADQQMEAAADPGIWDFAREYDLAIYRKDEDFAQRKVLAGGGPTMIWVRLPNTRRSDLLAWFDRVLPDIVDALERGETLIEAV